MTRRSSTSSEASAFLSSLDTDCTGTRAIFATTASISAGPMVAVRRSAGSSFCAAPASSMTSIALSGRWRSLRCLADSATAASSAASA